MRFVDIGEIRELRCVKSATEELNLVEAEAVGSKGNFRFCVWPVAYSRAHVSEMRLGFAEIEFFDIHVIAMLRQMEKLGNNIAEAYFRALKEGDSIAMPDDLKAWEILKTYPFPGNGWFDEVREWVDVNGRSVPEPENFAREYCLCMIYSTLHETAHGWLNDNEVESEVLLRILGKYERSVSIDADDHDFMMDWYEVTATAARTINNHIHTWKDCKPNKDKVGKFLDFCSANCQRMKKMCARYEYARHLWQRKEQIYNSKANCWKYAVEKVEVYRRGRFGVM